MLGGGLLTRLCLAVGLSLLLPAALLSLQAAPYPSARDRGDLNDDVRAAGSADNNSTDVDPILSVPSPSVAPFTFPPSSVDPTSSPTITTNKRLKSLKTAKRRRSMGSRVSDVNRQQAYCAQSGGQKQYFLVLGPESSGTKLATALIAWLTGDASKILLGYIDRVQNMKGPCTMISHRSLPYYERGLPVHGTCPVGIPEKNPRKRCWVDPKAEGNYWAKLGYNVHIVVTIRNKQDQMASTVAHYHARNAVEAAYLYDAAMTIVKHDVPSAGFPWIVLDYDRMKMNPTEYINSTLATFMGVSLPTPKVEGIYAKAAGSSARKCTGTWPLLDCK